MTFRMCWTTYKYYKTFGTLNVTEIWLSLLTAIKLFILLPVYWVRGINMLFVVFALNSICTMLINYMLSERMAVALGLSFGHFKMLKYMAIFWIVFFVAMIFLAPLFDGSRVGNDFYILVLQCHLDEVYRKSNYRLSISNTSSVSVTALRYLILFGMDFVVATVNLLVVLFSPKMRDEKDRFRQMRRFDVANVASEVKVG